MTLKLVWECWQAICTLSNRNKVMLLWVPGHSGIQGNEDTDALARK
jgi:ribonuclease HI